jgi:hypothetical protein
MHQDSNLFARTAEASDDLYARHRSNLHYAAADLLVVKYNAAQGVQFCKGLV